MLKYKILFQISGSIAAYKSAYLISKLVQNNFEVQTVVTNSALQFIGKATLEGLTGNPVFTDTFEDSKMMSHINLMKWADLIILSPASANTINKMATGIADNLVTSLFLAYKFDKPYLIAPAMNTSMFKHPATQLSLKKLKDWGVNVLPTDAGYLACGDNGEGKLLDPDKIYEHIINALQIKENSKLNKGTVLITAGATREYIDGVRFISNISTGKTASTIADYFLDNNYKVTYLHGINTMKPSGNSTNIEFGDFNDLKKQIQTLLASTQFDVIINNAAISDYTVDEIKATDTKILASQNVKIDSGLEHLTINLKPTSKIVDMLKSISLNKNVILIAFKFSGDDIFDNAKKQVQQLFKHSNADFIVLNSLHDRDINDTQANFYIFNKTDLVTNVPNATELSKAIEQLINKGS